MSGDESFFFSGRQRSTFQCEEVGGKAVILSTHSLVRGVGHLMKIQPERMLPCGVEQEVVDRCWIGRSRP